MEDFPFLVECPWCEHKWQMFPHPLLFAGNYPWTYAPYTAEHEPHCPECLQECCVRIMRDKDTLGQTRLPPMAFGPTQVLRMWLVKPPDALPPQESMPGGSSVGRE